MMQIQRLWRFCAKLWSEQRVFKQRVAHLAVFFGVTGMLLALGFKLDVQGVAHAQQRLSHPSHAILSNVPRNLPPDALVSIGEDGKVYIVENEPFRLSRVTPQGHIEVLLTESEVQNALQQQGFALGKVQDLRWIDGQLYMLHDRRLTRFDERSHEFTLLTAALPGDSFRERTLQSSGDGRQLYLVVHEGLEMRVYRLSGDGGGRMYDGMYHSAGQSSPSPTPTPQPSTSPTPQPTPSPTPQPTPKPTPYPAQMTHGYTDAEWEARMRERERALERSFEERMRQMREHLERQMEELRSRAGRSSASFFGSADQAQSQNQVGGGMQEQAQSNQLRFEGEFGK
jgi:hypothetical protein